MLDLNAVTGGGEGTGDALGFNHISDQAVGPGFAVVGGGGNLSTHNVAGGVVVRVNRLEETRILRVDVEVEQNILFRVIHIRGV